MKTLRFCIAGDNHGDEQNNDVVEKLFAWMDDFQPDIVIHGGDLWNFAALRKKATPDDQATAIAPDYEAGVKFAKRFFSYGSKRYFTRGNHDERIYGLARECRDAALNHYATKMVAEIGVLMRSLKVTMLPYDSRLGVLDVCGVRSIHGYAAGVSAARRFGQVYGTCAYNHTHSMDTSVVERHPEPGIATGVGALLNIDQGYNASQMGKLRHENGWVYGHTDGVRATYLQAKYKHGKVYAAETIKEY